MNWRKLLLSPHGRIGRKSYWLWIVLSYVLMIVAATIDMTIFGRESEFAPVTTIYILGMLFPSVCVSIKRLHDTDRSGWWIVMPCVTIMVMATVVAPFFSKGGDASTIGVVVLAAGVVICVVAIFMLAAWLGFFKGSPGPNKYGEPNSGDREVAPVVEVFS